MGNLNSKLTSGNTNTYSDTLASTNGLGDLGKLPRELRDIVYESMLANTLDQNVEVKDYLSRPSRDLPPIFRLSRTTREEIVLVAARQYNLVIRGHRTLRRLTSFLERFPADKGFASVESLELRGVDNIKHMFTIYSERLRRINRFPALQRLRLAFDAHGFIAIDTTGWTPESRSLVDLAQRLSFREIFACTNLRDLTLKGHDSAHGFHLEDGGSEALQNLGKWLKEEFEKRKMNVGVRLMETWTTRDGAHHEKNV